MPGCRRIDLEKMNNEIIFRKAFILYKNKFQGPKSYIAQMCEVDLQYGNSTTKWPFYTFFQVNSTL